MKTSDIRIPIRIAGLSDGVHEFDLVARPEAVGLPQEFGSDIALHVHMDKTHSQVILRVEVRSTAVYPCDRCLEPVAISVDQRLTLLYAHDAAAAKQADDDDVRLVDAAAPLIDIGDDVRDVMLLAVPMRRVCGEDADGRSLCKDQDTAARAEALQDAPDPRWAALEQLRNQHENN